MPTPERSHPRVGFIRAKGAVEGHDVIRLDSGPIDADLPFAGERTTSAGLVFGAAGV